MVVAGQPVYAPGPWGLLAREWQRTLRAENKSVNTIRIYLFAVRRFGEWSAARTPAVTPDSVLPRHVREFVAEVIEQTSAANAHTNYRALRTFFRWLESEEEIERSPMDRTKAPFVPDKPIPVITDDEVRAMIEACAGRDLMSRRDTAILRLFFDTGARLSEIALLGVDDVDLDLDVIRVLGKGRRPRSIPFGAKTGRALSRYLRVRATDRHADKPQLWLCDRGRGPLAPAGMNRILERRGAQAGLGSMFAHRFRHTLAHNWQLQKGNETDLMRIMGWKSPEMLRRYGASAADQRAHASHRELGLGDRV